MDLITIALIISIGLTFIGGIVMFFGKKDKPETYLRIFRAKSYGRGFGFQQSRGRLFPRDRPWKFRGWGRREGIKLFNQILPLLPLRGRHSSPKLRIP